MKNLTCAILIFMLTFSFVFAQEIGSINPQLTERPWIDKETRIIDGHSITQVFGETPEVFRHTNLGPITTVSYQSPEQVTDSIKETAIKTNWSESELDEKLIYYSENAPGGLLNIFISRGDESRANFKWFFVIIRDKEDQKVTEINLDYQAPQLPEGNGWWNYTTIMIDKPVQVPFYVYLNDKLSDHLSDFKFEISQ